MRPTSVSTTSGERTPTAQRSGPIVVQPSGPSFRSALDAATLGTSHAAGSAGGGRPQLADSPLGRWLTLGARHPDAASPAASRPQGTATSRAWDDMVERRARRIGGAARHEPAVAGAGQSSGPARQPTGAFASRSIAEAGTVGPGTVAGVGTDRSASVPPSPGPRPAPRSATAAVAPLPPPPASSTAPAVVAAAGPLPLERFPRPPDDNGRGLHWIPTVRSDPATVDRFVAEAKAMHARWVVFLNDGADVGANDYLVESLVENGIEPVMRVYTPGVGPIDGDLEGMVRHYKALGVDYFQLFNEPNLTIENGGQPPSVERYLDHWIPAARRVAAAGGLPGLGALAPGGDVDDLRFLRDALAGIKTRGALDALDRAWLSMHNYSGNRPIDYVGDSNGFLKFRWYDRIVREQLGRAMPIIGTEGGAYVDNQSDAGLPALDLARQLDAAVGAMEYVRRQPEPYLFATSWWVIANGEGGGHDPHWEPHALFGRGGASPLVDALRGMP